MFRKPAAYLQVRRLRTGEMAMRLDGYDYIDFGGALAGSNGPLEADLGATKGLIVIPDTKSGAKSRKKVSDFVGSPAERNGLEGKVRLTAVANCIERQSDPQVVARIIENAVHFSRQLTYVQLPWFASDHYLFEHGLKLNWSDWNSHSMPIGAAHLYSAVRPLLDKGAVVRVAFFANGLIASSDDSRILPINAPRNSGRYDPAAHGAKPQIKFEQPVFAQLIMLIARKDPKAIDWAASRLKVRAIATGAALDNKAIAYVDED